MDDLRLATYQVQPIYFGDNSSLFVTNGISGEGNSGGGFTKFEEGNIVLAGIGQGTFHNEGNLPLFVDTFMFREWILDNIKAEKRILEEDLKIKNKVKPEL